MLRIVEASADRWDDLAELLGERGDPARCWCQYYRGDGPYRHESRDSNRAALQRQFTAAPVPHGLLAYDEQKSVGWCAVAPRADYPRLRQMRAAQATQDADGLWSVTCFVVRVGYRRHGVAGRLLDAAVEFAGRHGARTIEAYPVDPSVRPTGSAGLYQGTLSMYRRAGFAEVARTSAYRSIVRLDLSGRSQTSPAQQGELAAVLPADHVRPEGHAGTTAQLTVPALKVQRIGTVDRYKGLPAPVAANLGVSGGPTVALGHLFSLADGHRSPIGSIGQVLSGSLWLRSTVIVSICPVARTATRRGPRTGPQPGTAVSSDLVAAMS